MARKVLFFARTAAQVRQAARWWQENRPAAPGAVATDFREALALLAEQPGIGAKYEGARTPGVRRLYLSRVRYFVYDLASDDSLRVLAFWHEGRGQLPVVEAQPRRTLRRNGRAPVSLLAQASRQPAPGQRPPQTAGARHS